MTETLPTSAPGPAPPAADDARAAGPGPVDWDAVARVARWSIARRPSPPAYRAGPMEADFAELTEQAEAMVAEATGLRAPTPARGRVIDRDGWVDANIASMQRLLGPTLRRIEEKRAALPKPPGLGALIDAGGPLGRLLAPLRGSGRRVSGGQAGLILAWLSTRVLGQYDLLLSDEDAEDQDVVYYVGPNIAGIEQRYGFPERPFRLWIALHEVTHRCQFTAVPWLRDYFVSLVDKGLEPMAADPQQMAEVFRRIAEEVRARRNPLEGNGLIGLVATPEQRAAIERIQALMSLLEGHGDATMDRAGAAAVPGAARFARVLRERRQQVRGPAKLLQQALGIEAKMRQYAEGEAFVEAVHDAGGLDLFNRVWRGPEWLPSLAEIRAPGDWVARVGAAPALG